MKTIYIMLTRTETLVSRTVHFVTSDNYTHASIAFDRELYELFSSTRKNGKTIFPAGPCREHLGKGFFSRYGRTPCALLQLSVEDEVYDRAYAEVIDIVNNQKLYKFNAWGLVFCRFGMPLYRKNKYFCSQFVGEILTRCSAVTLPKETGLIRPSDYLKIPELTKVFEGDIGELITFCRG